MGHSAGNGITVLDEARGVHAEAGGNAAVEQPPGALLALSIQQDLIRQLEDANRQLAVYARERQEFAERERLKKQEIELVNQQLRHYAEDLRSSVDRERQRSRDLEAAYLETVRRLTDASTFKDKETGAHIARMSHYARELALAAGSSAAEAERLFMAAPMHDLGKIGIPDGILHKPGPLSEEEWIIMRQHPLIGARLLEGSNSALLEVGREVAIAHHERWDGSGYPFGLRGEAIPFSARVVAIADTYDALRSRRAYKGAVSHERTVRIILGGDGRTHPDHFDPNLLMVFTRIQERFAVIFDSIQDEGDDGK